MWCRNCRQDVPAVAREAGLRACFRCGLPLGEETGARHTAGVAAMAESGFDLGPAAPAAGSTDRRIDDWELDSDARRLRRYTHRPEPVVRHASSGPPAARAAASPRSTRRSIPSKDVERASHLAWLLISLGVMAALCGGALVGWGYTKGRDDLWNLGVPIAAAGQLVLLVGLVLQLERIWHGNREAARRLRTVDRRLAELKQSAEQMAARQNASAAAFYHHYASGASPNLLLADLKGQIELLSAQLSSQ